MSYEAIHVVGYGDPLAGKSTFAATFPKPMLVLNFDPQVKVRPYLAYGTSAEDEYQPSGVRHTYVFDQEILAVQIEYYIDPNPERPMGYAAFRERMAHFTQEATAWATVVLDSVTFCEIAARLESQFRLNPKTKDPRQHYGYSTEELERMLMIRFGSLPMNVVVLAHIDEQIVHDETRVGVSVAVKDEVHGVAIRNPAAPGRMKKRLPAGYTELYRIYPEHQQSTRRYLVQTQPDHLWNAGTAIGAPDRCDAHYEALWEKEGVK